MTLRKFAIISLIISVTLALTSCNYTCRNVDCSYQLKQITMCDSLVGWAISKENEVLYTENGVQNFEVVKKAPNIASNSDDFINANFIDEKIAYITYFSSDEDKLVVEFSKDSGKKWEQTYINYKDYAEVSDAGSAYLSFIDEKVGYILYCSTPGAGMMTKIIFKTEDAGTTFQFLENLSEKIDGYPQGISFVDESKGYISTSYHGQNNYLYKTTDNGKTWKGVEISKKEKAVNYIDAYAPVFSIKNKNEGIILLKEVLGDKSTYNLFFTSDGGNSWVDTEELSNDYIISYSFLSEKNIYAIDMYGKLYRIFK